MLRLMLFAIVLFPLLATAAESPACRVLRESADARTKFPGVWEFLCETPSKDPGCQTRNASECTKDALCARHYGSSNCGPGDRGPCLPDMIYKSCGQIPAEELSAQVIDFSVCVKSRGSWVSVERKSNERASGKCDCMHGHEFNSDPSTWTMDEPLTQFIRGQGCMRMAELCREKHGTWINPPLQRVKTLMSRSLCTEQTHSVWESSESAYGYCTDGKELSEKPQVLCLKTHGASWKPYADPIGNCSYIQSLPYPPHCESGGKWLELNPAL